ncbi:hypothetical protein SVIO_098960 [Streptomyces violaceusniger]|uniref:Uncharacterized protein n=1 Tax=Streptomyces violaceusniger TaxID=68280 RepID=A0A4D4LMH3_STRVO|nr:hypothetical protein SVIO_098960 [Streptomyces violaceusniger]
MKVAVFPALTPAGMAVTCAVNVVHATGEAGVIATDMMQPLRVRVVGLPLAARGARRTGTENAETISVLTPTGRWAPHSRQDQYSDARDDSPHWVPKITPLA